VPYGEKGKFAIWTQANTFHDWTVAYGPLNLDEMFMKKVEQSINEFAANVLAARRNAAIKTLLRTLPWIVNPPPMRELK
jgi:hypothetical protein